jgi:hypothetical protein
VLYWRRELADVFRGSMHRAVALTLQCGDDESFLPEKGIQISLCFFEQPNPFLDFSNILCLIFHVQTLRPCQSGHRRMNTDVCRWFLSARRMFWPDPVRSRKNTIAARVGAALGGHGVMLVPHGTVLAIAV